jgi:hypothetical protein
VIARGAGRGAEAEARCSAPGCSIEPIGRVVKGRYNITIVHVDFIVLTL